MHLEVTAKVTGQWLPGDAVPETLVPILHWQFRDQLHHIHQVMDKTTDWINTHPQANTLPRLIGKVDYRINGVDGKRLWRKDRL